MKPGHEAKARLAFADTGVVTRTDGNRHLGGAVGSDEFTLSHMDGHASG